MTTLAKGYLVLTGLIFILYGGYCLINTLALTDATGMSLSDNTALIEVRAMYGGLQLSMGLFLFYSGLKTSTAGNGLLVLIFIYGGLAIARAIGLIIDGGDNGYNFMVTIFEGVNTLFGLFLLLKIQSINAGND